MQATRPLGAVDCGGRLAGCPPRLLGCGLPRGGGGRGAAAGVAVGGWAAGARRGHELERRREANHETREKVARLRESRAESPEIPRTAYSSDIFYCT